MKNELYHHGILGQKWGIRRYQNDDGTLTEAGKRRYQSGNLRKDYQNRLNDLDTAMSRNRIDAVKTLEEVDRLAALKEKSLGKRITSNMLMGTPITKKGISKRQEEDWIKLEIYSKYVEIGKTETNQILRNMSKQNMGLNSKRISKARLFGKKYYDTVKQNADSGNNYYVLNKTVYGPEDQYSRDNTYTTDVMGNKYKVSRIPHGKYRSLR